MSELDPETHRLHDETMAEEATLQQAVNATAGLGLREVPANMTALGQAIAERGLVQPPRDWLNAVATELALGNRYVVGTRSEHDAAEADRERGEDA